MEIFEFQPLGKTKPDKKDVLRVERFPQEVPDDKKLKDGEREKAEAEFLDLFIANRAGPEFQNRLASFLLRQNISFDETDPYFIKLTRLLSEDRRTDNKGVSEVLRAVSSLVFFLRKGIKPPNDPDQQRLIGYNNALDAQYSVDVMDIEYEIINGQVVVSKLHLIDVKSFEGMAVEAAPKVRNDHSYFSERFEMIALWQDTPSVDLSAKAKLSQDVLVDFIDEETETMALLEACEDIKDSSFNLESLKEKIIASLKQEPSLELLDSLVDILQEKEKINKDPDLAKAIAEILLVIEQALAELKDKKVKKRAPVIFAPEAEIKSILAAKRLASGKQGGVLDTLTRDMSAPGLAHTAA
ncbi:hypothetical protein C4566_00490 [Candidatus Parcubacteria bacterium]|nr:MAG: hypothetical protein C4566_00490 [Candidatus Parcubacteria bacterium]